jgi:hypothetical protein
VATLTFLDDAIALVLPSDRAPSPKEIFLAWLLGLPDGVDASEAAAAEIARLDRTRLPSPQCDKLRELFVEAATCASPTGRLN